MNNNISIEKILLHNQNNDLLMCNISTKLPIVISPNELYTLPVYNIIIIISYILIDRDNKINKSIIYNNNI